ncbi:1-acyl-sn-glycerol-3-phosphate acyltransferase [Nocardia sp. NPDC051030]|uniref:1-acyl-sn-glycerol-3-phosphate acyltransferase n=1 Tax=Nocardia sp. NPDC051030 TaxID=3155162 RepID=UPI0034376B56
MTQTPARLATWYFRGEVRGLEHIPDSGPALLASMHSGVIAMPDAPVLFDGLLRRFGSQRPIHVLAHDGWRLIQAAIPGARLARKLGVLAANRDNARAALRAGSVLLVFPGGEYDQFRPIWQANTVDFGGRTGFLRIAYEEDVPLIPVVHVGSHETSISLSRGESLVRMLRIDRPPFRVSALPVVLPQLIPFPAKITIEALPPIDLRAQFPADDEPDYSVMYAEVMKIMQAAVDKLAAERRFPILG